MRYNSGIAGTVAGARPAGVVLLTISVDLPCAQARGQSAEHVEHAALSAHQDAQFGRDYGVLIKEWRLLQRAVFAIDRAARIVYAEYVSDQMREPDYSPAMIAARQAAACGPTAWPVWPRGG